MGTMDIGEISFAVTNLADRQIWSRSVVSCAVCQPRVHEADTSLRCDTRLLRVVGLVGMRHADQLGTDQRFEVLPAEERAVC